MAEQISEKKELAIVAKVKKMLKLDDAGRIELFIQQEIKSCKTAIKQLKHNQSKLELDLENAKDTLILKLEDCKMAVENSYTEINPSLVKTNADRTLFSSRYWNNINAEEDKLKRVEKELEQVQNDFKKELEHTSSQIQKYQDRIDLLSKTV